MRMFQIAEIVKRNSALFIGGDITVDVVVLSSVTHARSSESGSLNSNPGPNPNPNPHPHPNPNPNPNWRLPELYKDDQLYRVCKSCYNKAQYYLDEYGNESIRASEEPTEEGESDSFSAAMTSMESALSSNLSAISSGWNFS